MIKAGIIGGAGYTGGELIRLLLQHAKVVLQFVHSRSNAGKLLSDVHQDLLGETDLEFTDNLSQEVDVLFLCLGHGESKTFLQKNTVSQTTKIIDLSNDFRLIENAKQGDLEFIYGLPELNKKSIISSMAVANPGCFATAIQLGLLPLANAKKLPADVYTTGITGSTGAGQTLAATSHFSWRTNNIQPYKTLVHQHNAEIERSLKLQQEEASSVHFVPWRGDFSRGIFVSSTFASELTLAETFAMFENYYSDHPFVHVSGTPIFLKQVVNTNKAIIHIEKEGKHLVVHTAIDNLLKGASGQALQNMNLMFGLPENEGLQLKANYF